MLGTMRADPTFDRPLSEILGDFASSRARSISFGELTDALGGRAVASLVLLFGLVCALPLPPGATTLFGAPLVVLAPQLLLRDRGPWTPQRLRARRLPMSQLRDVFERVIPWLRRMEAVSRPRLGFLVGRVGRRLIGLICTVFALVLILPIPLGNMLPAASVSLLSLALVQRDGIVALLGYALAAASVGVLALAVHLAAGVVRHAASALPIS
jgi:hypothetical protein